MASLQLEILSNDAPVNVTRRPNPDLPDHVLGSAYWHIARNTAGYYCEIRNRREPIEFINDSWYGLGYESGRFFTRKSFRIAHENTYNLGYWSESDPQHPSNQTNLRFTQADNASEDEEPSSSNPNPVVTGLAAALTPVVSLQGTQPLNAPLVNPTITPTIIASAIAQPPSVTAPPANPPAHMARNPPSTTGSLRGVPPNVFTGDRSRSEAFLNEFRRYRPLNKNNKVISNPFTRVLTALSYIKGPIVEDWVNAQDRRLER